MNTKTLLLSSLTAVTPAFAQGGDDCSTATTITAGAAVNFDTSTATDSGFDGTGTCAAAASTMNQDRFWQFTAPSTGVFQFDTNGSTFDTKLSLHDGVGCAAVCRAFNDDGGTGTQSLIQQPLMAGDSILIQVGGFNAAANGAGTLTVTDLGDPCTTAGLSPDAFENSDDCASAAAIGDGTVTGLNVSFDDNDYYAVSVADGATLDVSIAFIDADGDIDLYLWDPAVACDTNVVGTAATTGFLARGFSASDNESISYTNNSGATQDLIIEIDWFNPATPIFFGCNAYDLTVTGSTGATGIGTPFCTANPNSTGVPGLISATGSDVAADNNVTLNVAQIPAGQFGIFVVSSTAGAANPVNDGVLCLSGMIGRYSMPSEIWQADASGAASLAVDLTMVPQPMSFASTNPGDTWFFQAWHRDIPIGNSNFTTGVEITFN